MSFGALALWLTVMVLLVLLNAVFVATEFALVATRRSRIKELVDEGRPGASLVQALQDNMDASVSGTQLGITLSSLALGWVGENSILELVNLALGSIPGASGLTAPHGLGFVLSFLILSSLHVVVGEQVPKFLALRLQEKVALRLCYFFRIYSRIMWPLIWVLNGLAGLLLRMIGFSRTSEAHASVHTAEELEILIDASEKAGELEPGESDILKRVLDLKDVVVATIMVERSKMDCVDEKIPFRQLLAKIVTTNHSRLPVYRDHKDNIVGVLHTRDLFALWLSTFDPAKCTHEPQKIADTLNIRKLMRPVLKVAKDAKAGEVLEEMRRLQLQMAVMVELEVPGAKKPAYQKAVGMVTMENLVEQVVGPIQDEHDPKSKTQE